MVQLSGEGAREPASEKTLLDLMDIVSGLYLKSIWAVEIVAGLFEDTKTR